MRAKDFIPASKPRNFVAKNQKTGGAGAHKDKKKAEKQGYEKHKKKVDETELRNLDDLRAKRKALQDLQMDPNSNDPEIKQAIMQRKADLEKEAKAKGMSESSVGEDITSEGPLWKSDAYTRDQRAATSGFGRRERDWDEGDTEPPNNFAIYINGKKWKVFKGNGYHADDHRERAQLQQLKGMCAKKSAATGKKWEVYVTGEAPTA